MKNLKSIMKAVRTIRSKRGAILHETKDVISIVTFNSVNEKTGNMFQIWHLVKSIKPTEALKKGLNSLVCGDCSLQGDKTGKNRTCYVNLGQGPRAVYTKWQNGGYPKIDQCMIKYLFAGENVRFGAYGNPSILPLDIIREICNAVDLHTGYIHNWNTIDNGYSKYFMASVETIEQYRLAKSRGFRTFRIVKDYSENLATEITCLSDSKGLLCKQCGLCNGGNKAKDITIKIHGTGKTNFKGDK